MGEIHLMDIMNTSHRMALMSNAVESRVEGKRELELSGLKIKEEDMI